MQPIKIKLGSMPPAAQTQITPVPGAPPPIQSNAGARPTAVGAQATVKSPKAKMANDMGQPTATPQNGVLKLKGFMDNRANKKNKGSQKIGP